MPMPMELDQPKGVFSRLRQKIKNLLKTNVGKIISITILTLTVMVIRRGLEYVNPGVSKEVHKYLSDLTDAAFGLLYMYMVYLVVTAIWKILRSCTQ